VLAAMTQLQAIRTDFNSAAVS